MLMFVFQTPHSKECSTARPENHVESWEGKPFTNILSPQCYIIVWTPRSSGKWLTSWALVVFGAPTNATASPQRSNWPLPGAIPVISGCSKPQSFGVPSYGHDHHGFTHTNIAANALVKSLHTNSCMLDAICAGGYRWIRCSLQSKSKTCGVQVRHSGESRIFRMHPGM